MAIIKCPECGHTVSDQAEVCPNCGIKIANQLIVCPYCSNKYLKSQPECPNCHHRNTTDINANLQGTTSPTPQQPQKKNNTPVIITSIIAIVVALACVAFFIFGNSSSNKEEQTEYEYALSSDDADILQKYLDNYSDAPEEHRQAITDHLNELRQMTKSWTDALVNNSKSAIEEFMRKYPNSRYEKEAMHKIDSLDWVAASASNTIEAYENYKQNQPNGDYFDKADECIRDLKTQTVQPEEEVMINMLFKTFFQGLNTKSEKMISETLSPILMSFLGKSDATQSDVMTFIHKIYKSDVARMDWNIEDNCKISKKEIGNQKYEYAVEFGAIQDIENIDGSSIRNKYNIKAKVSPDVKITEFNMTKILK